MNKHLDYPLLFDFRKFEGILRYYYPPNAVFTVDEALAVFYHYFECYEEYMNDAHPRIKALQMIDIVSRMDCIYDAHGTEIKLTPENYSDMIDRHFETDYSQCDYNINHFFAGQIRAMRYFETCY